MGTRRNGPKYNTEINKIEITVKYVWLYVFQLSLISDKTYEKPYNIFINTCFDRHSDRSGLLVGLFTVTVFQFIQGSI
jgi:hypothetical protein